jgi:septal ring factor EnvC (AmiA/AmiB activator)
MNRSNGRMSDETRKERAAAYRRLQSEYLIIEQDIRKKRRNHETLVAEIRKLKMDVTRMETSLREKTADEAKVARELGLIESEWGRIRRRMNMLA